MIRVLAALLALQLSIGPARADPQKITFEQDGLTRVFLLSVPDGLDGPVPLVIAAHGLLEDAKSMWKRVTRGRFETLSRHYGFAVAYPSAWGRVWNLGEGKGAGQLLPRRDDLAYLDRVIAETRARVEIDPGRIFYTGYSMGGMVGLSYACKRPGLIRAISLVASAMPAFLADDCSADPPRGVQVINGTADDVVPFEGGPVISGPLARMELLSFDDVLAFFARRLGCAPDTERRVWDEKNDGTKVTRTGWYDCAGGAVEGYRVDGGGHRWPRGGPIMPITGDTTTEIDGAAAVWGFFSRFQ